MAIKFHLTCKYFICICIFLMGTYPDLICSTDMTGLPEIKGRESEPAKREIFKTKLTDESDKQTANHQVMDDSDKQTAKREVIKDVNQAYEHEDDEKENTKREIQKNLEKITDFDSPDEQEPAEHVRISRYTSSKNADQDIPNDAIWIDLPDVLPFEHPALIKKVAEKQQSTKPRRSNSYFSQDDDSSTPQPEPDEYRRRTQRKILFNSANADSANNPSANSQYPISMSSYLNYNSDFANSNSNRLSAQSRYNYGTNSKYGTNYPIPSFRYSASNSYDGNSNPMRSDPMYSNTNYGSASSRYSSRQPKNYDSITSYGISNPAYSANSYGYGSSRVNSYGSSAKAPSYTGQISHYSNSNGYNTRSNFGYPNSNKYYSYLNRGISNQNLYPARAESTSDSDEATVSTEDLEPNKSYMDYSLTNNQGNVAKFNGDEEDPEPSMVQGLREYFNAPLNKGIDQYQSSTTNPPSIYTRKGQTVMSPDEDFVINLGKLASTQGKPYEEKSSVSQVTLENLKQSGNHGHVKNFNFFNTLHNNQAQDPYQGSTGPEISNLNLTMMLRFFPCGPVSKRVECADICNAWNATVNCGEASCYCDQGEKVKS